MDTALVIGSARIVLAMIMAAGGLYALNRGYNLFLRKSSHDASAVLSFGNVQFTGKSVGAVTMITASFWGLLSYFVTPNYKGGGQEIAALKNAVDSLSSEVARDSDGTQIAEVKKAVEGLSSEVAQAKLASTFLTVEPVKLDDGKFTLPSSGPPGEFSMATSLNLSSAKDLEALRELLAIYRQSRERHFLHANEYRWPGMESRGVPASSQEATSERPKD